MNSNNSNLLNIIVWISYDHFDSWIKTAIFKILWPLVDRNA
jgi:hypothetical protein